MEKKNILKNTTDVAALLAVILSAFVIFVAYSSFEPSEDAEKFYDVAQNAVYIGIVGAFSISLIANIFSRKSPFVGLAFSLLPLWYLINCFSEKMLTGKNPMLYVLLSLVHLAGALIYTVQWVSDREPAFSRATPCGIGASVISVVYFGLCALVRFDEKYGEPLFYLRAGIIFVALCSAFAALIFYKREKKGAEEKINATAVCVAFGFALSLVALVFECFF